MPTVSLLSNGKAFHTVEIALGERRPEGWINQTNCPGIKWPDAVTFEHNGHARTVPLVLENKARGNFLRAVAKVDGITFGANLRKGNVEARPSFLATYTAKANGKIRFAPEAPAAEKGAA